MFFLMTIKAWKYVKLKKKAYYLFKIHYACVCVLVAQSFATPWTVARQAPLSMGLLLARILEWVAIYTNLKDHVGIGI